MKRKIAMTLMLATLAGSPAVFAQNPAPNTGATAPAPTPAPAPARPSAEATHTAMSNADARNCLEFPTNLEVIKCAEKYLPRRPKG